MQRCDIDMSGAPYGIYAKDQSGYTGYMIGISETEIEGNSNGVYGVYLRMLAFGGSVNAGLDSLSISGLSGGTGIYVADYSPHIEQAEITGCKWGLQLAGSGSPGVQPDSTSQAYNTITSCTTGIYATAATPDVDAVTMSSCTTGLYTASTSGGTYTDVDISGGSIGFNAASTGTHAFREGSITGFSMYGLKTSGPAGVDLGTTSSYGNNNVYSSNPAVVKYVSVRNAIPGNDIMAEKNWWGAYPAPSAKFSTGVDYAPELTSASTLSRPIEVELERVTPRPPLVVMPNPFSASVVLDFEIPEAGGAADLSIFDISGRLVRRWQLDGLQAGRQVLTWDGRNDAGVAVSAGIYFVRYEVADVTKTTKLVRVLR